MHEVKYSEHTHWGRGGSCPCPLLSQALLRKGYQLERPRAGKGFPDLLAPQSQILKYHQIITTIIIVIIVIITNETGSYYVAAAVLKLTI